MDRIRAWLKAPRNPFRQASSSSKKILYRFGGSLPSEPTLDQTIEVFQMGLQMTDSNDPANPASIARACADSAVPRGGQGDGSRHWSR